MKVNSQVNDLKVVKDDVFKLGIAIAEMKSDLNKISTSAAKTATYMERHDDREGGKLAKTLKIASFIIAFFTSSVAFAALVIAIVVNRPEDWPVLMERLSLLGKVFS